MDLFAYLLLPTSAPSTPEARQEEAEAMAAHFRHLQNLREGRILKLAGIGGEADFGLVVFRSESLSIAQTIMASDPLVAGRFMSGICVPFQIVLPSEAAVDGPDS